MKTMLQIRAFYEQDHDTWVVTSPDLDQHWVAVADSMPAAHELAETGIRFVVQRDDVNVVHMAPTASARTARAS